MKDKQTFKSIYLKYYSALLTYGKCFTKNECQIEDTIQELFLDLLQKNENLSLKLNLENYLFVSFRNNLIRKLKTPKIIELDLNIPVDIDSNNYTEEEVHLIKLLDHLPNHQKEVIFLRFYKNKSYREISEILGIKYQVTRNFSHRAIKFLRKNIRSSKLKKLRISV